MIHPSACQPWRPDLPGHAGDRGGSRQLHHATGHDRKAEASERGRSTGRAWKGGVFSPADGVADPSRAVPIVAQGVLAAGGTIHQMCAARGLETQAGRVSGVVTERGTIRTQTAVMAGGAWASSFCRQLGIRFPQSSVRSSILAVSPYVQGVPDALHTREISVTRRGAAAGHTLAISGRASVDPTPHTVLFAREFVPMFSQRWQALRPGGLQAWMSGHETAAKWRLDRPTPMERVRILDPVPDRRLVAETHQRALALLPALRDTARRPLGLAISTPRLTESLRLERYPACAASTSPPVSAVMALASAQVPATL